MPDPTPRSAGSAEAQRDHSRDPFVRAVIAACALVAVGLDALQLSRPGYLFGRTADIGVYLSAAAGLVHGILPYRGFVMVQPPGIALLLGPAGLLSGVTGSRDALAAIRLAGVAVAAANVLLVGGLVRHRGRLAALVASGLMALYPAETYALNAGLLDPLVDLLCLAGASLVFAGGRFTGSSRHRLLGGVLLGVALTVKLTAIVPLLAIVAVAIWRTRRRSLPLLAGTALGFAVPSLPFLVASPGGFVRDVLLAQLARLPAAGRVPLASRLAEMTFGGGEGVAIAAAAIALGLVAAGCLFQPRRRSDLEWFAVIAAAAVAAVQLVPAQYYPQYAALLAPFWALALGLAAERLVATARARQRARAGRPSPAAPPPLARRSAGVPDAGFAVALVALLALLAWRSTATWGMATTDPGPAVDAVVPSQSCTLSDAPALLAPSDRISSDEPGCAAMVDPYGTMLAYSGDTVSGVALFRDALARSDYVVLDESLASWLSGAYAPLRGEVTAGFHLVRSTGLLIYVRDSGGGKG